MLASRGLPRPAWAGCGGQELPQGCGPQQGQQTRPTGALPAPPLPAPGTGPSHRSTGPWASVRVSWTLRQRPAALGLTLRRPAAGASPHAVAPCLRSTAPRSCLTKNAQSTPARAQVHPGAHRGDTSQGTQGPGRTKSLGHSVPSPPCGADEFTQCVRAPSPELAGSPVLGATGLPRAAHPSRSRGPGLGTPRLRGLGAQGLGSRAGRSHAGFRGRQPLPHTPAAIAKSLQAGQARTPPTDTEGPRSQPRVPAGLRGSQQREGHPGDGCLPPPTGRLQMEGGLGLQRQQESAQPRQG